MNGDDGIIRTDNLSSVPAMLVTSGYVAQTCVGGSSMDIVTQGKRRKGERGKGKSTIEIVCVNCGKQFTAKLKVAKYCSPYCKNSYARKMNPEGVRERVRRSHVKHKDKELERNRIWHENHPDYNRDRYRNNLDLRLWNYKDRCKKRNIEWALSDEQALKLFSSHCYYCGEDGLGIDRINNSIGYTPKNSVPCCKECNIMKMDTDVDTFIRKVIKIAFRWNK